MDLAFVLNPHYPHRRHCKHQGLDWNVVQRPIMTSAYEPIPGYKANIRDIDNKILGVVSDRYRVVQNAEAFAFTDALLGKA